MDVDGSWRVTSKLRGSTLIQVARRRSKMFQKISASLVRCEVKKTPHCTAVWIFWGVEKGKNSFSKTPCLTPLHHYPVTFMSTKTLPPLKQLCITVKKACDALTPMILQFYTAMNSDTSMLKADKSVFTIADGTVQHLLVESHPEEFECGLHHLRDDQCGHPLIKKMMPCKTNTSVLTRKAPATTFFQY